MSKAPAKEDLIWGGRHVFEGCLYGVELEIEAPGLYAQQEIFNDEGDLVETEEPALPPGWVREEEESIQGVECVFEIPLAFSEAVDAIGTLFADIEKQGYRPIRTPRGSTHVHVNASDLTWDQLRSLVIAAAWAEPLLTEIAGKGRRGNLFAMSYETAPLGWTGIIKAVRDRHLSMPLDTHYMGVNFNPLQNLGSIEFRMGPSARSFVEAVSWLSYIDLVVSEGRTEEITGERHPNFMHLLKGYVPEHRRERALAQAARQAKDVWEQITLIPPKPSAKSKLNNLLGEPTYFMTDSTLPAGAVNTFSPFPSVIDTQTLESVDFSQFVIPMPVEEIFTETVEPIQGVNPND